MIFDNAAMGDSDSDDGDCTARLPLPAEMRAAVAQRPAHGTNSDRVVPGVAGGVTERARCVSLPCFEVEPVCEPRLAAKPEPDVNVS